MKDFKILKILDLFKIYFEKLGINYPVMRKILHVKLLLDGRRTSAVLSNKNSKRKDNEKEDKNYFAISLVGYFILGLFLILYIVIGKNFLLQMSLVFGFIMFVMMTSLIADFSSVLLDSSEKVIILSRPVDNKTYNMAKILHIFIYISMITLSISGPSLIVSLFRHGITFFLIYLFEIVLISLFVINLTTFIYLLVLRFFSGEKLKDIINYIQIILTIAISFGYQMIFRFFNFLDINKMGYKDSFWKYLLPPIWFSGPFELLINQNSSKHVTIYSILAIVVPILSIIIYIKLIPSFESYLLKLNSVEGKNKNKDKFTVFLSKLICKERYERTFFRFATKMMKNERTFKLKVYPSLGIAIIFPFFMIISMNLKDFSNIINTKLYLWIYMTFTMIPTVIWLLEYSGNYKGAWIFETIPINEKSVINKGTVKAAIVNLFMPVFVLVSIVFLIFYKMKIFDQILVVGINMILYTITIYKMSRKFIPFTKPFEGVENTVGGIKALLTTALAGVYAIFHYLITKIPFGTYIYVLLGLIFVKVSWKKVF